MSGSPPAEGKPERFELDELAGLPPGGLRSPLPVGRHGLPRAVVARNQRLRAVGAMLNLLPRNGYYGTSIGDLTKGAGISRAAFYEQFEGKEGCFLAAYDIVAGWLCGRVEESIAGETEWVDRVRVGVGEALRLLAANAEIAHLIAIEAQRAGRAARQRHQASIAHLAELLRRGRPDRAESPRELDEMLLGGAFSHVALYVEAGRTEQLPRTAPELVRYLLAPFLRPEQTQRIAERAA